MEFKHSPSRRFHPRQRLGKDRAIASRLDERPAVAPVGVVLDCACVRTVDVGSLRHLPRGSKWATRGDGREAGGGLENKARKNLQWALCAHSVADDGRKALDGEPIQCASSRPSTERGQRSIRGVSAAATKARALRGVRVPAYFRLQIQLERCAHKVYMCEPESDGKPAGTRNIQ